MCFIYVICQSLKSHHQKLLFDFYWNKIVRIKNADRSVDSYQNIHTVQEDKFVSLWICAFLRIHSHRFYHVSSTSDHVQAWLSRDFTKYALKTICEHAKLTTDGNKDLQFSVKTVDKAKQDNEHVVKSFCHFQILWWISEHKGRLFAFLCWFCFAFSYILLFTALIIMYKTTPLHETELISSSDAEVILTSSQRAKAIKVPQ